MRHFATCLVLLYCLDAVAAPSSGLIERGNYLMNGILACGHCHAARGPHGEPLAGKGLSGGAVFDEKLFRAYASNITQDRDTGIGKWSDADIVKVLREGVRPDGSVVGPPMPVDSYRRLSDDDMAAIVAVLRSEPAVSNPVPKSIYRMPLPPNYGPPLPSVAAPSPRDQVRYGEYLSTIGHCTGCHTQRDEQGRLKLEGFGAGGRVFTGPWGASVARNLTPHASGLKDWSDVEIARAIRDGVNRDGVAYKPPMPFAFFKHIDDADMAALTAYLRSLPPLPFGGH
jgi:mono/diheme cytochrome c family protein